MEGIPDLEPLEHSVLKMTLDSGLTEGISHLEPFEHSVLNAALNGRPMEGTPVLDSLEHSVLDMALDGGLTKGGWWTEAWSGPQTNIFGNTPRTEE